MSHTLYVVSACLAGTPCRYDGTSHPCARVISLVKQGRAVPLCPECLGNLPTPRTPCELQSGKVVNAQGQDFTAAFMHGANVALQQALHHGATAAIVKSRSPSCGWGAVYDGTFSKNLVAGNGLWTELLLQVGFSLYSEESLPPHEVDALSTE